MEWAPYLEGTYKREGIFNGKPIFHKFLQDKEPIPDTSLFRWTLTVEQPEKFYGYYYCQGIPIVTLYS